MSTWWMLNSSTLSMITNGSSWGYLMSRLSLFEKIISGSSFFGIFIGGSREWNFLFISLMPFFKDFNVLPIVIPLEIVFISPVRGLVSPISKVLSWSSSVGTCMAPSFWRISATSLVRLKFPPGLSSAYTYQYDARGPSGIYSTCSCPFFLLEC